MVSNSVTYIILGVVVFVFYVSILALFTEQGHGKDVRARFELPIFRRWVQLLLSMGLISLTIFGLSAMLDGAPLLFHDKDLRLLIPVAVFASLFMVYWLTKRGGYEQDH